MTKSQGRTIEVDTLQEFDRLAVSGATAMRGWRVQSVDLIERTDVLATLDPAGALFLGCDLTVEATERLLAGGALLFPELPEVPFDPYRSRLYTPEELYAGIAEGDYEATPDAAIYAWSQQRDHDLAGELARALHDHAIDEALAAEVAGKTCVGVMGGHALPRNSPGYAEAAELGRSLARSQRYVVTGGGPGAMEAANLGAFVCDSPDDILSTALDTLAAQPGFVPSVTAWARAAFAVRQEVGEGTASLGIPTWFYGHEPPNAFASSVAKYFQNSLREDTLLRHCNGGIVFLPGVGGTVQEIFQDACENYYADAATVAPMVLVGRSYWTDDVPVWPLLRALASGRAMEQATHLVGSAGEALGVLAG
ncbi:MAG: Rossmann fold nucleotide-binding protein [Nocardioidaceae bacterium]